jgi:putative two-component system response regulator
VISGFDVELKLSDNKVRGTKYDTVIFNLQVETQTLRRLIDSCVNDFDGDGIDKLVLSLSETIPSLLKSSSPEGFESLVQAARLVALSKSATRVDSCIRILLDVGFAHVVRGKSLSGTPLVERALELATKHKLKPELRRACSVYAALSLDIGLPARGIEYALRAANLAKELGQPVHIAMAFVNMTAALFSMGLYRETISVGFRTIRRYAELPECAVIVGAVRGNMASAALALQQYALSAETAKDACQAMGLPRDAQDVLNRMAAEGTWLKSAIGLEQNDVVEERVKMIRGLADSFQSPRIELNRKLAEAAYEIYAGDLTVAVTKLLGLTQYTKSLPTLYRDNLVLLVKAYEQGNDHEGALLYLGELVEFLAKSQVTKVRGLLQMIQESVQTPMPGKDDVREMLDNLHKRPNARRSEIEVPQQLYRDALERLAVSAEMREDSFGRHAYRVGKLAGSLAREVGYDDRFADEIDLAARLHDIGKLGIPDGVLMKPDKLSAAEFTVMERHTEIGAQILAQCSHPAFRMAEQIALHHHEKWDGAGYPRKLAGAAIPEVARITAVGDVYDALTHVRAYKHAWTHEDAMGYITAQSGMHFEPRLVDAFTAMITRIRAEHGAAVEDYLAEAGNASTFLQARDEMHAMLNDVAPLSEGELL